MFAVDPCLALVTGDAFRTMAANRQTILALADALSFEAEMPQERFVNAVKEELEDLVLRATAAVTALPRSEASAPWFIETLETLRSNRCYFPRVELRELVGRLAANGDVAARALGTELQAWIARHEAFERRVGWLMRPDTTERSRRSTRWPTPTGSSTRCPTIIASR